MAATDTPGRREPRYPATLPLRWREPGGTWRSGLSRDLSPRGLFVVTGAVPRAGGRVEVELNGPAGLVFLYTLVRWTRAEEGPGAPRGMGLEIAGTDEKASGAWAALVESCADKVAVGLSAAKPSAVATARPEPPRADPVPAAHGRASLAPRVGLFLLGVVTGWLLHVLLG